MDLIGRYDHDCFSFLLPRTGVPRGMDRGPPRLRSIDASDSPSDRRPHADHLQLGVAEVAEGDDVTSLLKRAETEMSDVHESGIGSEDAQWPGMSHLLPRHRSRAVVGTRCSRI